MLQEDSNGETFEIIDKKAEELSIADKTESLSSMSSSASLLPSPSVSLSTVPGGNLLSNVAPPTVLPTFIATSSLSSVPTLSPSPTISPPVPLPQSLTQMPPPHKSAGSQSGAVDVPLPSAINIQPIAEPFQPTQFSAAIPPSKGIQHGTISQPTTQPSQDSGGLISWMKGAVSSGGILSKVAEKAKNSVDSMITTLDPQMREYIYSGGDLDIIVASGQEIKISPIREAFQSVFGKATIKYFIGNENFFSGISVQATDIAAQPVGFAAGIKAAEERIHAVMKSPKLMEPMPVVAIENFLLEVGEDKWYDLGVLILNDPIHQITLQTFTQMTPVPTAVVTLAQEDTPADYPLRWSGLSVTIGSLMASNLNVHHSEWHQALTGVSRREIILLAAKTLASLYKTSLSDQK